MSLIHMMYASRATEDFKEYQIPDLLKQIRSANARREVTGMLVYVGGAFFQVLEGEQTIVESLYQTILRDKRHVHITKIIVEAILERTFTGWTMGYSTVHPLEAGQLIGENDFFTSASCVTRMDAGRAKTLLSALSKRRWQLAGDGMHEALGRSA